MSGFQTIGFFSVLALTVDCFCAAWLLYLVYSVTRNLEGKQVGRFRALALAFAVMGVASKVFLSVADFFGGVTGVMSGSGVTAASGSPAQDEIAIRFAAGHLSSAVVLVALALFIRASFRAHDTTIGRQREKLLKSFPAHEARRP